MGFHLEVDAALCDYDPDDNPGGLLCNLEDGWLYLTNAARVWDLLGSDRGERLRRMMREELEPAEPAHPGDTEPAWMAPSQVERLLDLLDGLPEAAEGTLVDESWRLLPDREVPADLGTPTTDAAGRPIVTLSRTLSEVHLARRFFADARRLGCFVSIG
jgi:hypothetical protein